MPQAFTLRAFGASPLALCPLLFAPRRDTRRASDAAQNEIPRTVITPEKIAMRIPILLFSITLVVFLLVGRNDAANFLAGNFFTTTDSAAAPGPTRFSSVYSALTKCGSGMTKKEEREAEKNGSDLPTVCKGFGGYVVDISYSACASNIAVEKGETRISLAMQTLNYTQKAVEWRLANGKPFAVIMRVYEYGGGDLCTTDGKVTSESLVVKGLKGFEHIDEEVKVKGTPNPNAKARELADKGYAKPKTQ